MTDDTQLPTDLVALERALVAARADAGDELKSRAMARVARELADRGTRDSLQYAAAVAAAVVLLLNVGLGASRFAGPAADGLDPARLQATCRQLNSLELDLPAEEVARHCMILAAGGELRVLPRPYGGLPKTQ